MISIRCILIVLMLSLLPAFALAAEPVLNSLDSLRAKIVAIPAQPGDDVDDAQLTAYIVSAYDVLGQADQLVAIRSPEVADLDARLAELGAAPSDGSAAEDKSVTTQRASLQKSRNALDADIRGAKLLAVDSQQAIKRLIELRRQRFTSQIAQRTESPLTPAFWSNADRAYPSDRDRAAALISELRSSLVSAFSASNRTASITGLSIAALLLVLAVWPAEKLLLRLSRDHMPAGRLRRSALAVGSVVIVVLVVGLAAQAAYKGLAWNGALSDRVDDLGRAIVRTLLFAAFVFGLGRAILSPQRQSWRLAAIDNVTAQRLRLLPALLALAIVATTLLQHVIAAIGASLSAAVITQTLSAILLSGVIGWAAWRLRVGQSSVVEAAEEVTEAPPPVKRPLWLGVTMGVCLFTALLVWVAIALGYVALGSFVARQLVWASIVGATLFLAMHFIDDLITTLLSSRGDVGKRLQKSTGVQPRVLDQSAALLTGASRVGLVVAGLAAVVVPFGSSPSELAQMSGRAISGLKIGEIAIAPGAIGSALLVLVGGLLLLRVFKNWLSERFLPFTDMEVGMRSSITTLLGYVGGIVVISIALSALGIGLERIAWVASALSVGIGFGLQAIVQNFISGLILLAERPVRVGDWVVLGDAEGDVRRINVRATEIQLGDRSTLIVPNSEFITKTVRNVTLANAEGRVLIRIPMPLDCPAERVRQILLDSFAAHERVLDVPQPSVSLEGIQNGQLMFLGTAFVPSPRQASGVRSDVLFDVLARLRASGIDLSTPTNMVLQTAGPADVQAVVPGMGSNTP